MKKLLCILVAGAAVLFSPALLADTYPSKPITLVAIFGPGSASDTICRVLAQPLGVALKQTVIVENRAGANGALAALYVARRRRTATHCCWAPTPRCRRPRS